MSAVSAAPNTRDSLLDAGLRSLGLSLSSQQRRKLEDYLALLAKWNRTYNLTAIREPSRMVTHHLLDALAILPHLPQQPRLRLLDVGAGGGLPGIPLAIARPDWTVTLIDSSQKKATFLMQAAIELALPNVSAVAKRVEEFTPEAPFDIIVSRAFADLASFARASIAHLAPGGRLYAMKGVLPEDEMAALPDGIEIVQAREVAVPGLEAERHLIAMQPRSMTR